MRRVSNTDVSGIRVKMRDWIPDVVVAMSDHICQEAPQAH